MNFSIKFKQSVILVVVLALFSAEILLAQSSTIQLRNGSFTTTILPSASTSVVLQVPALTSGTHYIATSTSDPGASGISLTNKLVYGATSPQNTLAISGTSYLFDAAYANTVVNATALGARVASTATDGNNNATGLTVAAGAIGSGTGLGVGLSASSPTGRPDALYIGAGRLTFLEAGGGAAFTTSFQSGDQSANVTYTLPNTVGSNGQFLVTNGSGTLSWATPTRSLDAFSNAKSEGSNFSGSILLGSQATGTLSNASNNTGVGPSGQTFTSLTSGDQNTAIGAYSLMFVSSASDNTAVGYRAQYRSNNSRNTSIGNVAHYQGRGQHHVSVGHEAGFELSALAEGAIGFGHRPYRNNTTGDYLIGIGYDPFYTSDISSSYSIAIGKGVFGDNSAGVQSGSYNIGVGSEIAELLATGENNVVVGSNTCDNMTNGARNVVIGRQAADDLTTGSDNVILGYTVGSNNSIDIESNLFLVDNSNTATPLLQGDFSADYLTINGDLRMSGGIKLAVGADQAVNTDAATIDATAYSVVKVTSDNDTDADVITITGGNNGMVMYIDFVNTGNNDVTIGGVTHAITNTKSAGITVCRINGTWRVVGIAEY